MGRWCPAAPAFFRMVKTPYGEFEIIRKDCVAISVVEVRHSVTHHRVKFSDGDITHIEHRKIPKYKSIANTSWCKHIATYDLDGNEIELL